MHLRVPEPYDFALSTARFREFGTDGATVLHDGGLHRVVQGREVRIVVGSLPRERPRRTLALSEEDVADDLVHVDRHAERGPHADVLEDRAAHVVADVRIAEGEAGGRVEPGVVLEARDLLGLSDVSVGRPRVEGELGRQEVRMMRMKYSRKLGGPSQ